MSDDFIVVPGVAEDIESVMPVMDTAFDPAFGEAWTRSQCLGILSLSHVWLTLAKTLDGHVCGFSLSRTMVDEAELLLLAVEPAMRGRGIGRALVERCAADAAARGAIRLMLEMRDGNPAGALYDATRFIVVGRRKAYYRGNDGRLHDALTMRRHLDSTAENSGDSADEGASFAAAEALDRRHPSAS